MALGAHSAESQDAVSQGLNNNLEFFQLLLLATESTSKESALSSKLTEHCPRHVRAKCPSSLSAHQVSTVYRHGGCWRYII